jgi:hypothetical protein
MSAARGTGAAVRAEPAKGTAASAADPERKPRRVSVMAWFPKALKVAGTPRELAASAAARQPSIVNQS